MRTALVLAGLGCTGLERKTEDHKNPPVLASTLSLGGESDGLMMADRESGETVWEYTNPTDLQMIDSRPGLNGDSVWYFLNDAMARDGTLGTIEEIGLNGEIRSSYPALNGHHSFDVFSDDDGDQIIAYLQADVREDENYGAVVGDAVVEIDSAGQEHTVISTFDVLTVGEPPGGFYGNFYKEGLDLTHANHLRWQPETKTYLMSLAMQNAVLEFTRSGEVVVAYLGQDASAAWYTEANAYTRTPYPVYTGGDFELQHGPAFDENGGLWLLDNRKDPGSESLVKSYQPDPARGVLIKMLEIPPPEKGTHSLILGGVLAGDDWIVINWGSQGILEELDTEGQVIWTIEEEGLVFSHISIFPFTPTPSDSE